VKKRRLPGVPLGKIGLRKRYAKEEKGLPLSFYKRRMILRKKRDKLHQLVAGRPNWKNVGKKKWLGVEVLITDMIGGIS